ncbi:MAG: LEPR-XLL domain-containing protein, partial [Pseudomonadota bacterium]
MSRLSRKLRSLLRGRSRGRSGDGVRSESMEKRVLFSADVPWADPFIAVMDNEDRKRQEAETPVDAGDETEAA